MSDSFTRLVLKLPVATLPWTSAHRQKLPVVVHCPVVWVSFLQAVQAKHRGGGLLWLTGGDCINHNPSHTSVCDVTQGAALTDRWGLHQPQPKSHFCLWRHPVQCHTTMKRCKNQTEVIKDETCALKQHLPELFASEQFMPCMFSCTPLAIHKFKECPALSTLVSSTAFHTVHPPLGVASSTLHFTLGICIFWCLL